MGDDDRGLADHTPVDKRARVGDIMTTKGDQPALQRSLRGSIPTSSDKYLVSRNLPGEIIGFYVIGVAIASTDSARLDNM
jgi:hypothetical protein